MTPSRTQPAAIITVAVVNDVELVVRGVATMLGEQQIGHQVIRVVECAAGTAPHLPVDVALVDTFAVPTEARRRAIRTARHGSARNVLLYAWSVDDTTRDEVEALGLDGAVSKKTGPAVLRRAIVEGAAGRSVWFPDPTSGSSPSGWQAPGGLSIREAEVLTLLAAGHTNPMIAAQLSLSSETVKTYLARAYDKIGVHTRTRAALWAVEHGLVPADSGRAPQPVSR